MTYVTGAHTVKTGFQFEQLVHRQLLPRQRQRAVHVPERCAAEHPAAHDAVSRAGSHRRPRHLRPGSVEDRAADVQLRPALRLRQRLRARPGHPGPCPTKSSTIGSPACRSTNRGSANASSPQVSGIPSWKDINPRLGVAYDLFGNGRTAIKTLLGRYVAKTNVDVAVLLNPITTVGQHREPVVDRREPELRPRLRPGELRGRTASAAPLNNPNFGKNNPNAGPLERRRA